MEKRCRGETEKNIGERHRGKVQTSDIGERYRIKTWRDVEVEWRDIEGRHREEIWMSTARRNESRVSFLLVLEGYYHRYDFFDTYVYVYAYAYDHDHDYDYDYDYDYDDDDDDDYDYD